MQPFEVVRRIFSTFGKDLNMPHSSTEIDVDLTVLAVVLPFHVVKPKGEFQPNGWTWIAYLESHVLN